jgi:hypothetical protein
VSSLARALSQLTKQSLRPGSGRRVSISGLPRHLGGGDRVACGRVPSKANRDPNHGSDHSGAQTDVGGREYRGCTSIQSAAPPVRANLRWLDRFVPAGRYAAIETTSVSDLGLNRDCADDDRAARDRTGHGAQRSFALSPGWDKQVSDLIPRRVTHAGSLLLDAFIVGRAAREQMTDSWSSR